MTEVLVRYLHFVGIIVFSMALVSEHILLSVDNSLNKLRRLAIVDGILGVGAFAVLVAGLLLWWGVGKPAEFYSHNWVFHLKLTLFAVIVLLSIYPTIFFIRNRAKKIDEVTIPNVVINLVRAELTLLLLIPLCAVFMARGFGLH